MKWTLIMILLSVFSFSIFTNALIMQNNIIYAQVEPPLLSSPSSDPLTTAQSILKTLDENTVKALEKTNTTKTLLNLNIVLQALKGSNENSSSIEATKLLLNDAIQALNNNDTTRASEYMDQTNLISFSSLSANQTQDILDPLPSWNDVTTKHNIIEFVQNVTNPENTDYYIHPEDRIAVFDNDGTLWSEKPIPFQGYFSIDRVPTVVAKNPELKDKSPFKEILAKNFTALKDMTEKEAMDLIVTTHSNISEIEFDNLVKKWAQNATHPETKRLFVNMIYQPMLELLHFLKTNQFKEFIVSGGGVDFMREALSSVYEIPKDQIIGSSLKYKFVDKINNTNNDINNNNNDNKSFIFREPILDSFDNTYEKPANIALHIGKVPVIVAGNSDGDLQMLEYADDNNPTGKSLKILIHHDDPIREFSYDKGAEKVLEESMKRNWNIISMKDDFTIIFPPLGNKTSDVSK